MTNHALDTIQLHARHDGTDVDCLVQGKADAQSAHAVADFGDQILGNAFLHQQARARTANLPLIEPDSVDQSLDCAIQVGIVEDDERRLSSQLKRQTFGSCCGGAANGASDFGGTGERNFVHVGMFHQCLAGRAVSGNDVDDTGGQSGLLTKFSEGERGQRSEFRGLQHDCVSGGESRSNLPRRHEQREIPGDNLPYDTTSFVLRKLLLEKLRPARMVVEVPRYQGNVDVTTLADGLAVVHRLQNGEKTGMFLHQPRQGIEVTRPDMRSEGTPFWKRRAGSLHGAVDVRG